MRKVTVIGAGIGGLAAATALAQRGAEVTVLERAPELTEVGAGLQISPNGLAVLDALGLGEDIRAVGVRNRSIHLVDGLRDRTIARLPLGDRSYLLLHRFDLVDVLARGAKRAGVTLRFGQDVDAVADGPEPQIDGVAQEFVLGADGLRSIARPVLNGAASPVFSGQVAWRAVVTGDMPSEARVDMGPGKHLVRYPLRDGRINLVGVVEDAHWRAEGWHHAGDPDTFRATFADLPGAREDLARVSEVGVWGLFLHPVAQVWAGQNVAILGDAAHPTLPFLAQGANLALEDAWSFAAAFERGDLPAWQAVRQPRVQRALDAARSNARNYHLTGPARMVAHLGLRGLSRLSPDALTRRFDWLYGYDVTRER
ncbi:FAD-dependent oxidoreductase [Palleronia caenipelagi]|uniref:FAD-dependent oxidoreductase n=1 Tax=Palleronia caenipelagi TaxID=2489174 RepID=A0A547Q9M6_9RHOB|nr:FAD-dependent oxidoreductase [Palleronia caenipelagi]TRD23097.1 FAD-dependent oxidoreductase [Palleronia caenipelagi]